MLDAIISLLSDGWAALTPVTILNSYESGVILRAGKFHRLANAGVCFKIPFYEQLLYIETVITTETLPAQTLTTKDFKQVVVMSIVKYEIKDVKPYLLEIYDQTDVLCDVTLGAVQQAISNSDFKDLFADLGAVQQDVLKNVRLEVNRYGFKVHKVTFGTIGAIKTIRLITENNYEVI